MDPLVLGWEPMEVIWEVAIKEGLSLDSRIEREPTVVPNIVYRVTDPETGQKILVCLDNQVRRDIIRHLSLSKADVFVCRDAALDDETSANLALQCRLKTI